MSFCSDVSKTKLVSAENTSSSRTTSCTGRENTTDVASCSATGRKYRLLLYVNEETRVYGTNVLLRKTLSIQWHYTQQAKVVWLIKPLFEYFPEKGHLIPSLSTERPVLIVYNGYATHADLEAIYLERNSKILWRFWVTIDGVWIGKWIYWKLTDPYYK
jgi:hypothetical protein